LHAWLGTRTRFVGCSIDLKSSEELWVKMLLERNGGDFPEDFWRGSILHPVSQRRDNRIVPTFHYASDLD
jgi:hypothetical protein